MTTLLYYHPACLEHLNPPGHPERPDRLRAIERALEDEKFQYLHREEAPLGDASLFELAHPADHVARVKGLIPESGMVRIDGDTAASPGSFEAALRALGAATAAVDAVFTSGADNAFCAIRPPGHHAEKTTAMGFCLFNTIAVAARYAQQQHGAERVAIIDFDVHHGNGTQDIFWNDKSVLFASSHQMPLYPGTGALNETGAGNIFNAPLRDGDDGDHFREAFMTRILPAVDDFAPDLILVSTGFDAHVRDPLAGLRLVGNDFDWVTGKIKEKKKKHCGNKVVSLLEGGYDLVGLAESAAAHVNRLARG